MGDVNTDNSYIVSPEVENYLKRVLHVCETHLKMSEQEQERFTAFSRGDWFHTYHFYASDNMSYSLTYDPGIGIHIEGGYYSDFIQAVNKELEAIFNDAF